MNTGALRSMPSCLVRTGCLAAALAALGGCGPLPSPASLGPPPHSVHTGPAASDAPPAAPQTVGADTVQVMPGGAAVFRTIASVIASARHTLHVEVYEFARSDLSAGLVAARTRGVQVTVIDDPTVPVSAATATMLRADGVDVVDYPVGRRMIDHVKLLVADAATAVVGGINWGTGSDRNHDFDALVRGPAVANLDRVFVRDLVTCGRLLAVPPAVVDPAILVLSTLPAMEIGPRVLSLVDGARRSLDIELFVLTDPATVHALMRARQRGVQIRLLLDPSQRPSDTAATELRDAGVDVRIYHSSGEKLHAKAAVVDGRSTIFGSANWTRSGFEHNHELDIEIDGAPPVAQAFLSSMRMDWASAVSPS